MKLVELELHLRSHGCRFLRQGGGHTIWINPSNGRIASVPRHREIKEYTGRSIFKQLEIPQR